MKEGVFEIISKDAGGRIGRIFTKHGEIKTPAFFPVINPHLPMISPRDLKRLGFEAFITNAYTLWKDEKLHSLVIEKGIHSTYNWDGPIMTDSGAYQLMVYKDVEISNREILEFQDKIGVDIGVILDIPVAKGSRDVRKRAIDETYRRALEAKDLGFLDDEKTIWIGPIHGAPIPSLVKYSVDLMTKLPFKMYAMGSVVPLMEDYQYIQLIKAALVAKKYLPSNAPVHLFGAGHPAAFGLFVLLGFDTFDSASYALYARDDRYFTPHGTYRLQDLKELPCSCPVCSTYTASELMDMEPAERAHHLAMHHLYVIQSEIRRIREAIEQGTLWQLVASRVAAHPELARAYRWLLSVKNKNALEYFDTMEPAYKKRALLLTRREEIHLPIIRRYKRRLVERAYIWSDKLVLAVPNIASEFPPLFGAQVLILHPTFGLIPKEIRHVYPLFQHISYMDDIMQTKGVKLHKKFIERTLDAFKDKYGVKEIYVYDKDVERGKKIAEILDLEVLNDGVDLGHITKEDSDKILVKALIRYQFGPGAEDIIKMPFLEYSRNTGLLRKIYETELTKEEEEHIVKKELEIHMKKREKRGIEVPDDPYQELYVNKGRIWLVAALLPNAFKLIPHPLFAYRLTKRFKDELRYMIIIDEEAEPFVRDGRTVFSKFILDADESIRAEDEVIVVNESIEPVAIGKAILGYKEMKEFKRGAAVKNRWGFKSEYFT